MNCQLKRAFPITLAMAFFAAMTVSHPAMADKGRGDSGNHGGRSDDSGSSGRGGREDHGGSRHGRGGDNDADNGDDDRGGSTARETDRRSGSGDETRAYEGGWRAQIRSGRYEIFDPAGRLVIRRKAKPSDYKAF